MPHWIWKNKNWPYFTWDQEKIQHLLSEARFKQGNWRNEYEKVYVDSKG